MTWLQDGFCNCCGWASGICDQKFSSCQGKKKLSAYISQKKKNPSFLRNTICDLVSTNKKLCYLLPSNHESFLDLSNFFEHMILLKKSHSLPGPIYICLGWNILYSVNGKLASFGSLDTAKLQSCFTQNESCEKVSGTTQKVSTNNPVCITLRTHMCCARWEFSPSPTPVTWTSYSPESTSSPATSTSHSQTRNFLNQPLIAFYLLGHPNTQREWIKYFQEEQQSWQVEVNSSTHSHINLDFFLSRLSFFHTHSYLFHSFFLFIIILS
jgi:hypothetical protein